MKIAVVGEKYLCDKNDVYQRTQKNSSKDFCEAISAASKIVGKRRSKEVLGLSMIEDPSKNVFWGMKATYAKDSTPDNPVIQVTTNYGGKTTIYNVNINEVNSQNASQLEMFALSCYADDQGIGSGSTFGTYNTLKNFKEMAIHNGYFGTDVESTNTLEQYQNKKLDWEGAYKNVMKLLYECNDLFQYKQGMQIMNLFSKYPKV